MYGATIHLRVHCAPLEPEHRSAMSKRSSEKSHHRETTIPKLEYRTEDRQTLPPFLLIPILFGRMRDLLEPAAGVEPATF